MTLEDGQKYHALCTDERVMQYITGKALSREESDRMLKEFVESSQDHPIFGRYFVSLKSNAELIGSAKLEAYEDSAEIGYRLIWDYWGKGLATLLARELLHLALANVPVASVIAFVDNRNLASIRVLEKAGMQLENQFDLQDEIRLKYKYTPKSKWTMKTVILVIFGLIAAVVVAGLVMPKDYEVTRSIVVNQPRDAVYEYLRSLENQEKWSVWSKMDPNMFKEYRGDEGQVGRVYRWRSDEKDVGAGEQEIVSMKEGVRIDYELRFQEPFESVSQAYLETMALDSAQTKVTWGFEGSMPIPMNVMMPFMDIENSIGKDFDQGLANLKEILER